MMLHQLLRRRLFRVMPLGRRRRPVVLQNWLMIRIVLIAVVPMLVIRLDKDIGKRDAHRGDYRREKLE